ncbi:DeoR/GlpR family DNA-binding transcription regulator [uncultured Microbacterium sp.]|uniref:DeoR/GlpR family DNA-binding transcription regulator n=1 Tax=uncultured Microbacterium sp. TaxID=191216 RepID=UPI002606B388|nr:DeoR/GlpR family DNA-binding transcription regulator [uncultured Microbacterium sp.]
MTDSEQVGARQNRQAARQQAMAERVMAEGSVRIEALAEGFGISVMTVHRDLDELETRGLLRKSRGVATAVASSLVESSDVYRANREGREKEAIALAALELIEPGQSIMLDDSTTAMHLVPHLAVKRPLTVITNTLTIMRQLNDVNGITLIGIGGQYYNWCSSFMGRQATTMIASMRADVCLLSTAAITDDIAFHQNLETIDVKRAMFDSSARRVLMADHTKFSRRAMHTLLPLTAFDDVLVDAALPAAEVRGLRERGVNVISATRRRPTERA